MRFVYFSLLFATAYWFLVSLVRLILAKRNVNVIVESPERSANVNALERAWTAENPKVEEEDYETSKQSPIHKNPRTSINSLLPLADKQELI